MRPRHSLVTIHGGDELWTSVADVYRQVGVYTGRIQNVCLTYLLIFMLV